MLLREYSIYSRFAILPLPTNVSALPRETQTSKTGSLQSRCIPKMALLWFAMYLTFLDQFQ